MTTRILSELRIPIVGAPMAGGPSTPELAAAVSSAGGLGMIAGALLTPEKLAEQVNWVRGTLGSVPFGVNLFMPEDATGADVDAYAARLQPWFEKYDVEPGALPRRDDFYPEKFEWLITDPVPVVSSTFGTFTADEVARLHAVGTEVWATVARAEDASVATANGVDALVVQGPEAGGHRGTFDGSAPEAPLAEVLDAVAAVSGLPRIAAGGLMDGNDVAPLLDSGAAHAAQLGTALLDTPEAGTRPVHREQLTRIANTAVTRAFSGRPARGLENDFMRENSADAPLAYPDVHYLTGPMRAKAAAAHDPSALSMWAGTGHARVQSLPTAELMATWARQLGR
ncbi:nitronate monooxygenase [Rhodococcus sp. BP-252]|uniref:nitronate monooxygenase n=1 Tax=unclassified Rhodococcus (in: high G+C Gram-positive bacteria) TaxID=192944 RepID=UPI001C9AF1BA|nr:MULTISPECIES: nitronate monooxygenase [unclassified Rhodococcus (in: high G+C Gram-positive bacteria)]MBY6412049.1 nitronate monooxygenase [Rhodococcus sp. BP-320]MBY6416629.1 nitronate monooxygenase [Rhodococcus sp. BP-321]MBY6421182.1 nitronate monooxygenase [Rhodococcus sp. BP-324]MBY6426653.1 nitronate monooxygenase [Rhodococcus sp. BP-323]MBY6431652.1 nitronate monooxygenase [Rhodococcus sp. BP-322]